MKRKQVKVVSASSPPSIEEIEARQEMFRQRFADIRGRWTEAAARLEAKAKPQDNELLIYDQIGEDWFTGKGILPGDIHAWLKDRASDDITVRINSPGGSVFDGNAIHNALKRHEGQVTVIVDGIAASIASIVAMAGDEIVMEANAMMMVHDPHSFCIGTAEDMLREAEVLDTVKGTLVETYTARTGQAEKAVEALMSNSTWLTAKDAMAKGFCDRVEEAKTAASEPADSAEEKAARRARMNTLRLRLATNRRAIEAA
jgi:ATP-dependent protease ClpP protease subunit